MSLDRIGVNEFVRVAAGVCTYTKIELSNGLSFSKIISREEAVKLRAAGILIIFEPGDVAAGRFSL